MRAASFPDAARRRFTALAGLTLCAAAWPRVLRAADGAVRVQGARELMGTRVDLIAEGRDGAMLSEAIAHAFGVMQRQAALMSHYSGASGTAAIGLAAGLQPVKSAPELMAVLRQAQAVSQRSGGAFDATIGSAGRWHFDPAQPRRPCIMIASLEWRLPPSARCHEHERNPVIPFTAASAARWHRLVVGNEIDSAPRRTKEETRR